MLVPEDVVRGKIDAVQSQAAHPKGRSLGTGHKKSRTLNAFKRDSPSIPLVNFMQCSIDDSNNINNLGTALLMAVIVSENIPFA